MHHPIERDLSRLGLTALPHAQEELSRAYRRRAKALHPDVDPTPGAAARFRELHDAHARLSAIVGSPMRPLEVPVVETNRGRVTDPFGQTGRVVGRHVSVYA